LNTLLFLAVAAVEQTTVLAVVQVVQLLEPQQLTLIQMFHLPLLVHQVVALV
jgi:hypothetical protein